MTDRAISTIAEQLATNLWDRLTKGPRWIGSDEFPAVLNEEARNILAALKAARIAVVELPPPTTATENTAFWSPLPNFRVNRNVGVVIDAEGNVFAPDGACKYAAAILAAADAAEASQ